MPTIRAAAFSFLLLTLSGGGGLASRAAAAPGPEIRLWPGKAPGETKELPPEQDLTKPTDGPVAGQRLIRLGNVADPTLRVFRPPADRDTGAAVLVCPGGAYNILALDLEGSEVCEWLNASGITGVLLKYRVPRREGLEKHTAALQDAQRALGVVRSRATEFGIDPQRLGVLGFSAGGHLAAAVSTAAARTYERVDAADDLSLRPNFTVLIYPAYLTLEKENDRIAPELTIGSATPPAFITIAADDPVRMENAVYYALALKQAKVPVELHVFPTGGHGYGLRRTENPVTAWPDRVNDWLQATGWRQKK